MIAMMAALLLQSAAPAPPPYPHPDAEAERLGRVLAENGTLASLLPLMVGKETADLIAAYPSLSPAERDILRATAQAQATAGIDRLLAATGHAYATHMSPTDLAAAAAFQSTPAAAALRAATPAAIVETMRTAATLDFKRDTLAAFCAKTGKACPKP